MKSAVKSRLVCEKVKVNGVKTLPCGIAMKGRHVGIFAHLV